MGNNCDSREIGFSIENGEPYVLLRKNEEDTPVKECVPSLLGSMGLAIAASEGMEAADDEIVAKLLINFCIKDVYEVGTYFVPVMCAPRTILFVHDGYVGTMSVEKVEKVLLGILGGNRAKFDIAIGMATEVLAEVVVNFSEDFARGNGGKEDGAK